MSSRNAPRNALALLAEPLVVRAVRLEGGHRIPVPLGSDGSTVICNGNAAHVADLPWMLATRDGSHEIIVLDAEGKVLTFQISSARPVDPMTLSVMATVPQSRLVANKVVRKVKRLPCIAPGCKTLSRGPRFHYCCVKHDAMPKPQIRKWQKAWRLAAEQAKKEARAKAKTKSSKGPR